VIGRKVVHCYEDEGKRVIHAVHGDETETFIFEDIGTDYWSKLFKLEKEGYKTYEEA
jgi:hypothetical protein